MKQKTGRKLLSFLLTLAMLVGLMPGMSLTAYAATSHGITINTAQHGTVTASVNGSAATSAEEGATVTLTANPDNGYRLKSISGTYKGNPQETKGLNGTKTINGTYFNLSATDAAGAGWSLKNNSTITITSKDTSVKIVKVDFNITQRGNSFNLNNVSCSAGTKSLNGNTLSVSSINGTTVTLSSSANNVGYVRFNSVTIYGTGAVDTNLTISTTGDVNVRTFTMPAVVQGDVTITPVFEEIPKYNVTLNGGANATTSGGNTTQTGVTGAMTTVTYTANSGYHFTEFANITNNGITATRTNDTVVTVSGTPTADASITIPDAVADAVAVTGVTLNPSAAQTIDVDGKVSFTATVSPNNATDKKVKWSVGGTDAGAVKLYSDEACTTEVGADATETLTVYAKGMSAGSATVTATSNADSEKKASCDVTVNAAQTQTDTLLTTITGAGSNANPATSANVSYSTDGVATLTFSEPTLDGNVAYQASPAWGWWGYDMTLTVTPAKGYTITKCVFYDDKDRTATDSEAPFVVETTKEDKTPKVNGTPILADTSKGIKKIEVYGYATPASSYSVTITAGDHMTKTAGSGDAEQTGLTGAMTDVVYTANEGYYFPTDYSVTTVNGISVTRNSYTQITVSGTPTADATITLTAPTEKDNQSVPETTGFSVTNATNATSADGVISGVTSAMEYSLDGTAWTAVTGTTITGLNPGSVQIRLAGDDTHNASDAVTVAVSDQLADAKTAAKADLDTLLAGKTESNYDADDWTALNQAITDGKDNIDAATTIDEVTTAKTNAVTAVNAIKTKAEKLADAKTDAKADLDTLLDGKTEADYDADDWTALNQAITDGKTAIDNATTIDGVTTAKTNAVTAVNAIKTKAEKLADAKTDYTVEGDGSVTLNNMTREQLQKLHDESGKLTVDLSDVSGSNSLKIPSETVTNMKELDEIKQTTLSVWMKEDTGSGSTRAAWYGLEIPSDLLDGETSLQVNKIIDFNTSDFLNDAQKESAVKLSLSGDVKCVALSLTGSSGAGSGFERNDFGDQSIKFYISQPDGWTEDEWKNTTSYYLNDSGGFEPLAMKLGTKETASGNKNYGELKLLHCSIYMLVIKANQSAPAAPTMAGSTIGSVTLNAIENGEYKCGDGEWQESPTFTGLAMNTEYTFYQRLKGDVGHNASPSSEGANFSTADHVHGWSYSACGETITATCADTDGGHGTPLTATLTIVAPQHNTYGDGKKAGATITGSIDGVSEPTIVYRKGNDTLASAPADAGTYTANITLGGATASVEYTISPREVTVSGITAGDKNYDGNTTATLNTAAASFTGKLNGDTLTVSATGAFENANAGEDKTVVISGLTLGGTDKDNYVLATEGQQTNAIAKISAKEIGLTWSNTDLIYNGLTQAPTATATGLVSGDTCTVTVSGEQTNVGNNYTATASSLSNSNYKLPENKTTTFKISRANAIAATVTANNRTYDGTEKPLVTVTGETTGGTLKFAVTTENQEPNSEAYTFDTTSIPAKTNAGTYYVWYKVKADDTHIDSNPFCVTVKISKKPAEEEEPEKPAEVKTVAMYRLYNPFNREHLYTESENEKNVLSTKYGWKYEGIAWYAPEKSNTPVYRLYNPVLRDHHYTTDKHEKDVLSTKYGWKYEGIGWYSDDNKTVPIYRVFCPFITSGSHHFTAGKNEVKHLISVGWIDEKIGWYGVKEK